jgi:hypothetical protein
VTLDSNGATVTNSGAIGFANVSDATGIAVVGGLSGAVSNGAAITLLEDFTPTDTDSDGDLDGPFAQGANRFGIRLTGTAPFAGNISHSGSIQVEGNDSAAISLETGLQGNLTSSGSLSVIGDRTKGLLATSVSGDVKITGAISVQGEGATGAQLGDVGGALVLQSAITATGYRTATRITDDATRAKLDADDLKQGGPGVRLTGSIGGGVLLDRPPADADADNADEDDDGVPDASEATASIVSSGAAPALDIGSSQAIAIGVVGTGEAAFGIVNKGTISGQGVNDGVAATALRIGQEGGGAATIQGGINNLGGTISADAYGAQATGVLINGSGVVSQIRNTGVIHGGSIGGAQDARAIVDLSGTLSFIENTGSINAAVAAAAGTAVTGRAIAMDLSANTSGVTVRQERAASTDAVTIKGEVLFGSGDDRLELLAGTLQGDLSFGAGDDALVIDGAAQMAGALSDSDGRLSIDVNDGRLAVTNSAPIALSSLTVGPKGVLALAIDPAASETTRFNVTGAATLADGAELDVSLKSLIKSAQSFQVIQARSVQAGAASAAVAGAPFLYQASVRTAPEAGAVFVDLRPKTAAEIGLNRSESQAFPAVFDNLGADSAIETAVLKQTTREGFLGIYDQMLPDHSGGSLMSAAAIFEAVTSATGQPMRIDPDSATGAWAQELQFQVDRKREDAAGYRARGFGLAGGVETQGQPNAFGVSMLLATTDYHDRGAAAGEHVTMNLVGGAGYWRLNTGGFQAFARAGLDWAHFGSSRKLVTPDLDLKAKADWNGWVAEAATGASYDLALGWFRMRPSVSANYVRLSEGSYQEKGGGDGFDLHVASRKSDLLTGQALLTLGAHFGDETYFSPEVTVGYRARLAGDAGRTTARFAGGSDFSLDPEQAFDGGAVVRVGFRGGSGRALYVIDSGGTFGDKYKDYDLRASLRVQF